MELYAKALQEYLIDHCDPESDLLKQIDRDTHLKVNMPRMLSGHFQGRVLSMISKLLRPKKILEIGTYTGYSALCLAEGLAEGGVLHTIDINEELEDMVRGYFEQSNFSSQICYHLGQAKDIVPALSEVFDLVFIDADKKNNATYYELVLPKVRKGGVVVVDNVLWSGKVIADQKDKETNQIKMFNRMIAQDDRVEKLILPLRDGLFIILKK